MRMLTTLHTTLTPERTPYAATPEAAMTVQPKSPWHSPVPYLFGGLAAMLGLIAFALLILACSYWKLSRDESPQQQNNEARDLEGGGNGDEVSRMNGVPVFDEKIVVIMAGNDKPTFLATPLMLSTSLSKFDDHDDDDDHHHHHHHHHDHSTNAKDNGANKEGSSVSNDDDQDDNHDHDHDHVEDDDDEKDKEDETTHPPQN